MGQRLVVTVNYCEEEIAKIYYHWSAYTESALMETNNILEELLNEDHEIKDLKLRLIRFCERNGGGIKNGKDSYEWKYIQALYPDEVFNENINRNYGLIALSKEGMDDLQNWSEGDVDINLDLGRVVNTVNWSCDGIEEYNESRKEWDNDFDDLSLEDVLELKCDLWEFKFDDIGYLIETLANTRDEIVRYGNIIYELIA